jgi:hypothetical protein
MKIKADSHATRQIMKLDGKERNYIDETKERIHREESERLYE